MPCTSIYEQVTVAYIPFDFQEMMSNNQQEKVSRGSTNSNVRCGSNHQSLEDLSSSGGDDATLSLSLSLKASHAHPLMLSKACTTPSDYPNDVSLNLTLA